MACTMRPWRPMILPRSSSATLSRSTGPRSSLVAPIEIWLGSSTICSTIYLSTAGGLSDLDDLTAIVFRYAEQEHRTAIVARGSYRDLARVVNDMLHDIFEHGGGSSADVISP